VIQPGTLSMPLDLLGWDVVVPDGRIGIDEIFSQERRRIDEQLAALSAPFRGRLMDQLGIETVATFGAHPSDEAGYLAARRALDRAGIEPNRVGLIVDYSTLAADAPGIWSLAHETQFRLDASSAWCIGVRGSGCAGVFAALLVTAAMMHAQPSIEAALLVAADRAPDAGRSCLPVAIMADAASALVVARPGLTSRTLGRVRSVSMVHDGRFAQVLTTSGQPPVICIDGGSFERKVLPIHLVMLHRVLQRALHQADVPLASVRGFSYPNTTALDRSSVVRGLGFAEELLAGPGPRTLGHSFANDLVINAASWGEQSGGEPARVTAWLAAGSGFSWGAAVVEVGHAA
jgi:3-oxoacyl-[acyl-carrier-protein] synthase III